MERFDDLSEHNLYSDVDDTDDDKTYEPGDEITIGRKCKRQKLSVWNKNIPSTSRGNFHSNFSSETESNEDDPGVLVPEQPPREPSNTESDVPQHEEAKDRERLSRKRDSRKKFRREHLWKRTKSHAQRNSGKEYVDRKGKLHGARQLRGYPHQCRFKCGENISEEKRQEIFDDYWKLGNYDLQTSFIFHSVSLKEPMRYKKGETVKTRKSYSTEYLLCGHRVCKEFFRLTLDESNKRIDNIVKKKANAEASAVSPRDMRGKREPTNKIPQAKIDLVKEHINSLLKYVSHYTRARHPTQKYLDSNLNIQKLIALYKEFCSEKNVEPVSDSFYRHIFNTQFNIKFKKPHTDTCSTCDSLNNLIKHDQGNNTLTAQLKLHQRKAEAARHAKDDAVEQFKNDESTAVICFDLQKTLPTPNLTCSKVFYCRQLWAYNFCVHNLKTKTATMFMWHEGQAGRGSQEVASCLLKYIRSLPPTVKKIVAFSDNCGGQNKSVFIIRFWSFVVTNTQIESVDHQFFIPGHSFMECDQDFAVIENAKKNAEREIFIPEDWHRVVAKASRKFMVVNMKSTDFILLEGSPLDQYLVKKVPGIQKMMWFRFERKYAQMLLYKQSASKDFPFFERNLRIKGNTADIVQFPDLQLQSGVHGIKPAKYNDLQNLLLFIPPCHHAFYNNLTQAKPKKKTNKRSARLKDKVPTPEEEPVTEDDEEEPEGEVEPDNVLFTDCESE